MKFYYYILYYLYKQILMILINKDRVINKIIKHIVGIKTMVFIIILSHLKILYKTQIIK